MQAAARRVPGAEHVDRTDRPFVTLDPAGSTDLDQAFAMERAGDDVVLHYAIADVGFFVDRGDALDAEAWKRGVTVYMPDERARLYPAALSEGAASLLPDGPRPAVVFTVRVDPDGDGRARRRRAGARAQPGQAGLRDGHGRRTCRRSFAELARRIAVAEDARGRAAGRVPRAGAGATWTATGSCASTPGCASEDDNAGDVAGHQPGRRRRAARRRHRAVPGDGRARRAAPCGGCATRPRAFGLDWPAAQSLGRLPALAADRRPAGGGVPDRRAAGRRRRVATQPYVAGVTPWHAAMAATYAHATAPLRRLADRYVVEATLAVANGRPVPDDVQAAFAELPEAMAAGETRANRVDRAVIDLAEAVLLSGREGDVFDAVVVDEDRPRRASIQLADPAVIVARRRPPRRSGRRRPGAARRRVDRRGPRRCAFERVG